MNSPGYRRLATWAREYGKAGAPDQRALQDFMEVETNETITALRAEIVALSHGNFLERTMDGILGKGRKLKHGSYEGWAKMALLWMSEYKP